LEIEQQKEDGVNNQPEPGQQAKPTGWTRLWQILTRPHSSIKDIGEMRQAQLLAAFSLGYAVLSLIAFPAIVLARGKMTSAGISLIPILVIILVAYVLSRTRYYRIGSWLLVVSIAASFIGQVLGGAEPGSTLLLSTALAFVIANALLSRRAMILFVILDTILASLVIKLILPALELSRLITYGGYILTIGALFVVIMIFRSNLEKSRLEDLRAANRELTDIRANLEKHVQERTSELTATTAESRKQAAQLIAISEVSRAISQLHSLDDLLPEVVETIHQRFGFYHVGIFLLDDLRKNAILRATNSPGGKLLLQRVFRVEVNEETTIGYVALRGESRISQEPWTDFVQKENPELPETRSEMALPLLAGQMVIGVLDIQSESPSAFRPQDLRIMSTLADQVAIAIENVRLYAETRQALSDSQMTYERSVKEEWARLAQESAIVGYQYTSGGTLPLHEALTTPETLGALQTGDMIESDSELPMLAVPVKLRKETIGVLNIRASNPERKWSENEMALVEAAAERVALALENARLLNDASHRAQQERAISDISNKISASSQLDTILRTAIEELGRIYDDTEIVIQIGGKGDRR
jgi:GAF domain-containing protein